MEIPDYWAEARQRHRDKKRQVTVRRFGWSNISQADAEAMAQRRARQALEEVLSGAKLPRREVKVPYNGAQGLPIREEVLARHGEHVITRNSYGAHCLNTPHALFADIDFRDHLSCGQVVLLTAALCVLGLVLTWAFGRWMAVAYILVAGLAFSTPIGAVIWQVIENMRGGQLAIARRRIDRFLAQHPDWSLRLYRTPAGLRVLVTHSPMDPLAPEVQEFFAHLHVDPQYQRMCKRQNCFRARLTAKPWRIGIDSHMRPRPGVWPVAPECLAARTEWISHYERQAQSYAACHYIETVGSGQVHPDLRQVIELHDSRCQANNTKLPIA